MNGKWSECSAEPVVESCDNFDNDCDGSIDEGLTQACYTACGSGVEMCKGGGWINCSAAQPTAEACDGLDNDCDGVIDNPPVCVNQPPANNNNNNPPVTTEPPTQTVGNTGGCAAGDGPTGFGWMVSLLALGFVINRRRETFVV